MNQSYRELLLDYFEKKKKGRPAYSLRAFARDIGLKPSHLSATLRKKKGLSLQAALRISQVLALSDIETRYFCDLVESEHARNLKDRRAAQKRVHQNPLALTIENLRSTEIDLLHRWYYPCILELVSIHDGNLNAAMCAKALEISLPEAQQALNKLEKSGILRKADGIYLRLREYIHAESPTANQTLRNFHSEIAQVGLKRLETTPASTRCNTSYVMSFDSKRVDEAKEYITAFHQEFIRKFKSTSNDNSAYILSQNFFRADKDLT